MKSDLSRQTFNQKKHYSSVRMQQGRVQLDADWNEQSDIVAHRIETEALDVIGGCGGPLHSAAFHIVTTVNHLMEDEKKLPENQNPPSINKGNFLISAGRYYVDGILCENDHIVAFTGQPDLPGANKLIEKLKAGWHLIYLDVWQRSITALDDPHIREVALGGPDTATRTKTVWQVKYYPVRNDNCITAFAQFKNDNPPSDGKLRARAKPEAASSDPCVVPPGAGYRGLENQLYRVEIHDSGVSYNYSVAGRANVRTVTEIKSPNQVKVSGAMNFWKLGQAVELFASKAGMSDPKAGTLAYITAIDAPTLTLNTDISSITLDDQPCLRRVQATFKWSRDNGSVVTAIKKINPTDQEITVHDLGPDTVLGFAPGQWVEISDDGLELNGKPGQLAQITKIDPATNVITLGSAPTPLGSDDGINKDRHPKLRRWDGIGAVKYHPPAPVEDGMDLESGIQVQFYAGTYKTGDYWTIPARTATADEQSGNIEWPKDSANNPLALLPFGIQHHYCRLALAQFDANTKAFTTITDCRNIFPPVTELTNLFYVSGDGQEVMPDLTKPAALVPLPQSLMVGVANGRWPVRNAKVRFHVESGNGKISPKAGSIATQIDDKNLDVFTNDQGLALCNWQLDSITQSQQVSATLWDADDKPVHLPVIFTANLSVADQVAYNPGQCGTLKDQKTIQKAIDRLSQLVSLYDVSGDGQEVMPGEALKPLGVLAANKCGPVKGMTVKWTVEQGGGSVSPVSATTDANGFASCNWTLGTSLQTQVVVATLQADANTPTVEPASVRFTANLSTASHVAYDPKACPELKDVKTVQDAIDRLCQTGDQEPGIRVKDILLNSGDALVNDTAVPVDKFLHGLQVVCNAEIEQDTVQNRPTCFVTLDMPFPFNKVDQDLWQNPQTQKSPVIGFQPLILAADVNADNNVIFWTHGTVQAPTVSETSTFMVRSKETPTGALTQVKEIEIKVN